MLISVFQFACYWLIFILFTYMDMLISSYKFYTTLKRFPYVYFKNIIDLILLFFRKNVSWCTNINCTAVKIPET